MREIKFRVWDKYRNQLYICDDIYFAQEPLNEAFKLDEFAFMQYTGLKDANGKDIYEGDLVRFNHREGYSEVFEVVYLDENNEDEYPTNPLMCCYILFNRKTKNWMDFQWDETDYMEVIGDIYENSNLLESEEK